jgi:hypothetical protein
VAGEEAFWATKKVARRERRRVRKRLLKAELNNLGSSNDIDENSAEWDILWRTSEESSILRSSNGEE